MLVLREFIKSLLECFKQKGHWEVDPQSHKLGKSQPVTRPTIMHGWLWVGRLARMPADSQVFCRASYGPGQAKIKLMAPRDFA